jgi:hypothetical protein
MRHFSNDYTPNTQGHRVLLAFSRYPYLTAEQANLAAGYAPTAIARVWTALKRLTDAHYTFKDELPDKRGGNPLGVWSLLARGRNYLSDRGLESLPRVKHKPERQELYLKHVLAVNDVLIALERSGVIINSLTHDLYLARNPKTVPLGQGRRTYLSGDGLVDLEAGGYRYLLWPELDRGTEHKDKWQAKTQAIVKHAQTLGEQPLTVMVVTTTGNPRLVELVTWTEEQVKAMGIPEWADLFRFATDLYVKEPSEFFRGDHWVVPFTHELVPLIES